MTVGLQYEKESRDIVGHWATTPVERLLEQLPPATDVYGYALSETTVDFATLHTQYYMALDETVQPREPLTLTTTTSRFPADGQTTCVITVEPFVPCSLCVDGHTYDLSTEEPTLELLSDAPHLFTVSLAPTVLYWAHPLIVEATHATS